MRFEDPTMIDPSATLYEFAKIVGDRSRLSVGPRTKIDDFVFLNIGAGCRIGRNVHIGSFTSIIGGGTLVMEDFSGLSAGCRVITGTDDFVGPYMTNSAVPAEYRNVRTGTVTIGRHAVIGTNTIIFPGVIIGEGASVGAGCVIRKHLDPWGIYVGQQARQVGTRDREAILAKEQEYLRTLGPS